MSESVVAWDEFGESMTMYYVDRVGAGEVRVSTANDLEGSIVRVDVNEMRVVSGPRIPLSVFVVAERVAG